MDARHPRLNLCRPQETYDYQIIYRLSELGFSSFLM